MRKSFAYQDPTRWPIFDKAESSSDDDEDDADARRESNSHAGPAATAATDFSFHVRERTPPKSSSPQKRTPPGKSPAAATARDSDESEDDIDFSYSGVQRRASKALARQVETLQASSPLLSSFRSEGSTQGAAPRIAYAPICRAPCRASERPPTAPHRSELKSSRPSSHRRRRATARRSESSSRRSRSCSRRAGRRSSFWDVCTPGAETAGPGTTMTR